MENVWITSVDYPWRTPWTLLVALVLVTASAFQPGAPLPVPATEKPSARVEGVFVSGRSWGIGSHATHDSFRVIGSRVTHDLFNIHDSHPRLD